MSQYRTPTAYVLGVLVLLAVIVLTTPNGGTHARWSATALAEVPTMTTGRIGFEIAGVEGAESAATLTSTSGFDVRYRPVQVSLVDAAGESVALPQDMGFAYRTGATCAGGTAPAQWTAVAPGGSAAVDVRGELRAPLEQDRSAGLCLTVSTEAVPVAALRALNEQALRVVTQVEAASLEEGAWPVTRPWTVPLVLKMPAEEQPTTAPPRPAAGQCSVDGPAALLRWTWSGGADAPAVTAWEIWMRPLGTTAAPTRVKTVSGGAARTVHVDVSELPASSDNRPSQDYETLVRAVFATGPASHADSAYAWKLKMPGGSGKMNCEGLPS
jgi:hypothetical protein